MWTSYTFEKSEGEYSSYLKQKWLLRYISSVQFSRSVVSNSLRPHEPQHAMPPCPLPAPRVHPNPCPLSR